MRATEHLTRQQLDEQLSAWRELVTARPGRGWIRTIREALGMTASYLASHLQVHAAQIQRMEQRELEGTISLETLSRAAEAMECDLVYALVPRASLAAVRQRQAEQIARAELGPVIHTMGMEGQRPSSADEAAILAASVEALLRASGRALWPLPSSPDAR